MDRYSSIYFGNRNSSAGRKLKIQNERKAADQQPCRRSNGPRQRSGFTPRFTTEGQKILEKAKSDDSRTFIESRSIQFHVSGTHEEELNFSTGIKVIFIHQKPKHEKQNITKFKG